MAALRMGIVMAAVLTPVQIFTGDLHGLNTLEHQPAKVAAMEALWETQRGAPLVLFGLPDAETQSNRFAIELPGMASLILVHDIDGEVKGINEFPDAHPPVAPVFWSFRVMVGTGLLMLLTSWAAAWSLKRRGQLPPVLLKGLAVMTFSGWVGVLSGWYTTEIGRQPFLVTGVLRTADAVTSVPAASIGLTLALYVLLYAVLITAYITVVLHLARKAGQADSKSSEPTAHGPGVLAGKAAVESGHA
jgi:cytochrome d ubiquinol oxidase subunit I